ncbi:MAG: prolyl oligopeptidase family serine peptidase [Bacteroidia bacterium]
MKLSKALLSCSSLFIMFNYACNQKQERKVMAEKITYPATAKDSIVDDYFGTKVADPYRWLEYDTAANVKDWVVAENKVTFSYLDKIPYRDKIKKRLTEIFNYPKYASPFRAGEYYFFNKNDGLQNQSVIYFQKGLEGTPEVFLDPNKMSSDGTAAVSLLGTSKDKKYMAYAINKSGSDWQEIYVMEIATKKLLDDKLEWVKFSGAAWKGDGFYYSRYDKPVAGKEFSSQNQFHKIFYHKLGDEQDKDVLVYEDKKHPLRYFGAQTTEDERFLLVYVSEGTDGTEINCKDLSANQKEFNIIFPGFKDNAMIINNDGDKLLMQTDAGAPNQRVVSVDPKNPAKENWKDIVPEKPELLMGASAGGGKIFVDYLKDVTTRAYQYDYKGTLEKEIVLPGIGSAGGFGGNWDDKIIFYTFTSFTFPPTIYKYEVASGKSEVWQKPEVKFNPEDYETKQVFYPSKDGTKIPMFIVYKKGLKLDGNNPTLLYAYGGFNISLTPTFSTSRIILLENGGVYAMANLRGGGEYGEKWHEAGKFEKKQNVFDDFIAAAHYLIDNKYTSSEKLAIQGGSNGGLLVGACMTQHPELYKVCFPAVGVMDMLRYHKFTVGWGWAVEYGSSDSSKYFDYLYKYSPLHNLKADVDYPATLITTADHDDRVVPAHSFKFAATLQEKSKGTNPTLIRIDVKAGHGAGKPVTKVIDEQTDIWSFMFYNMGVEPVYK